MLGFGPETKRTQEQQQLHEGIRESCVAAVIHTSVLIHPSGKRKTFGPERSSTCHSNARHNRNTNLSSQLMEDGFSL